MLVDVVVDSVTGVRSPGIVGEGVGEVVGEAVGEAVGDAVKISSSDVAVPAEKALFESGAGAGVLVYAKSVPLMVEYVELFSTAGSYRYSGEGVASAGVGVLKRSTVRASQLRSIHVVHAPPPLLLQVASLFRTHGSLPVNSIGSNTSASIERKNV